MRKRGNGVKGIAISVMFLAFLCTLQSAFAESAQVSITSNTCYQNTCFIKNGINTLTFNIGGTVSDNSVYYTFPGLNILMRVTSCSGSTCEGKPQITCQNGQAYTVSLTNPRGLRSEDDEGRQLYGSQTLTCDNDPPVMTDETVSIHNQDGDTFYKSFDSIIIQANITERNGGVSVVADFSSIGGEKGAKGNCALEQDKWKCIVSSVAPEGPIQGTVKAYFLDTANNSVSKDFSVNVLRSDQVTKINAWDIKDTAGNPHRIPSDNREFSIDLIKDFNKHVIFEGRLTPKVSGFNILKAQTSGCYLTTQQSIRLDPRTQLGFTADLDEKTFIMGATFNRNDFPGDEPSYTFNCSVLITNKKGNFALTEQEEDWFTITMTSHHTKSADREIKEKQEKLLGQVQKRSDQIRQYYMYTAGAQLACDIALKGKEASGILEGSATGAYATAVGTPIGNTLDTAGEYTGKAADQILENPIGKRLCDLMTCSTDKQQYLYNFYNKFPPYKAVSEVAQRTMNVDTRTYLDPWKSLPIAGATACIPAVVYHLQNLNQINCEQLRCYSKDVPAGFPITQCDEIQSMMQCKYVYGGLVRVVPFVGIFQDMSGFLQGFLSNPWATATSAAMYTCHWAHAPGPGQKPSLAHSICGSASALMGIPKLINLIRDMAEQVNRMSQQPADYCSGVIRDYLSPQERTNPFANLGASVKCTATHCMVKYGDKILVKNIAGQWVEPSLTNDPKQVYYWMETQEQARKAGEASVKLQAPEGISEAEFLKPANKDEGKLPDYVSEADKRRIEAEALSKREDFDRAKLDEIFGSDTRLKELALDISYFNEDIRKFDEDITRLTHEKAQVEQWIPQLGETQLNGVLLQDVATGRKTQIEQELRNIRERKERTKDQVKTLRGQLKRSAAWNELWKDPWTAYSSAMAFGKAAQSLSQLFGYEEIRGTYGDIVVDTFETLNQISHFEDPMCERGFNIGYGSVDSIVINNVNGRTQSGAHVEGQREGPTTDANGFTYYNYLITGAAIPKKGDDFHMQVIAKGGTTKILRDYTVQKGTDEHGTFIGYNVTTTDYVKLNEYHEPTVTTRMTGKSVLIEFTSSSNIKIERDNVLYDRICLHFDVNDIGDYFTVAQLDNNELCNRIIS